MAERRENDEERPGSLPDPAWPHRDTEDDFVCLRYQVWYPSLDCAIRTKFNTAPGCRNCDQGRFNLKRHAGALRAVRMRFPAEDE